MKDTWVGGCQSLGYGMLKPEGYGVSPANWARLLAPGWGDAAAAGLGEESAQLGIIMGHPDLALHREVGEILTENEVDGQEVSCCREKTKTKTKKPQTRNWAWGIEGLDSVSSSAVNLLSCRQVPSPLWLLDFSSVKCKPWNRKRDFRCFQEVGPFVQMKYSMAPPDYDHS